MSAWPVQGEPGFGVFGNFFPGVGGNFGHNHCSSLEGSQFGDILSWMGVGEESEGSEFNIVFHRAKM